MTATHLLLVIGFSITKGAILLPCGNNLSDVPYGQKTVFTCNTEGQVQWHVQLGNSGSFELLAQCEVDSCYTSTSFNGLFVAQVTEGQRIMTVDAANFTKLWQTVQLVNGSLVCRDTTRSTTVGRCDLSLVYLPEDVSCRAVNTFWSVHVSCVIGKVFSSRGPYRCELFRLKDGSDKEQLETISMTTSPTSDKITRDAVKMSGACHFTSTIPKEEGNYSFVVSVLPSKLSYFAKFSEERTWYLTERPSPPRLSCWPSSCVLGHTVIVKCTCTAQHLGQPTGRLQLLVGNRTLVAMATISEHENGQLRELHHALALGADDNETWFRCDVLWGTEVIVGEDYTAHVICDNQGSNGSSSNFSIIIIGGGAGGGLVLIIIIIIVVVKCRKSRDVNIQSIASIAAEKQAARKSDSSAGTGAGAAGNDSKSGGSSARSSSSGSDKPSSNPNYTSTALQEVEIHAYMDLHTRDPTYAATASKKDNHTYIELRTKRMQSEPPQPPAEGSRNSAIYANQGRSPKTPVVEEEEEDETNYYNTA